MIIAGMVQCPHPMRALSSNKILVVILGAIALAALMVLASGLGGMDFQEGQPFGDGTANSMRSAAIEAIRSVQAIPLQTQLIVWIMLIIMLALVGLLLSPEARKRLIKALIRAALTFWLLSVLFTRYPNFLAQIGLNLSALNGEAGETTTGAPVPEFTPPQSASWMAYLLSFTLVALVLFIAWKIYSFWRELKTSSSDIEAKISKIARASILDLSAGRESTDVILNCYYRMSDAVSQRKSLDRNASMTPSEFASRLEAVGLPSDAVRTLTRLFESVRYGGRRSDPKMANDAVACLTSILQHCGEPA